MNTQNHKQVPPEIQSLKEHILELQTENDILHNGYGQLLNVSVGLLKDLSPQWTLWLLENVYRRQLTADVYSELVAQLEVSS